MRRLGVMMDITDLVRVLSAAEVFVEKLPATDRQDESIQQLEQSIARVLEVVTAFEAIYLLGNVPQAPASVN